jgi:hypothetical protein
MTENQESWSPFHYTYNNPVKFTDPDGREPCCRGTIAFVKGAFDAIMEDNSLAATSYVNPNGSSSYSAGAKTGHVLSMIGGVAEIITGVGGDGVAVASEAVTVGGATPLALPLETGSISMILHGGATFTKAVYNLNSEAKSSPYSRLSEKQLQNSKSSYEKLNKDKLSDFKSDPIGKSDPDKLKEAMKGGAEAVKKFLQGRIESLNKQIKKQEGELQKINEEIKHRDL